MNLSQTTLHTTPFDHWELNNCLDDLNYGILPQRWMGRKIYPIENWGGMDIDKVWQLPFVQYWLEENGFTNKMTPYVNN